MNVNLNVTRPWEQFSRAFVRLGFLPAEADGRKVVQLTFSSPDPNDKIVYRIPFVSDESERMTLLVHDADFIGVWGGSETIPEAIREEAHRQLCQLLGDSREDCEAEAGRADDLFRIGNDRGRPGEVGNEHVGETEPGAAVNGGMAPEEHDLVRLGKEMKAMKTNSELEQEGLVPDPIQN